MKFAHPWWLFGTGLALLVAVLLVVGGAALLRSVRRFGDEARVRELVTGPAGARRALKGTLVVLAVALAFVALAQPQYGRGTRLIPATNLDVVVVLDFSKSMYARDVAPSRIDRAKSEVSRLIADLPGARFAAVAFSGEPLSFPLTSDGAAIAQFFQQLTPNDMPVGGTAIARALQAGRDLLERDPVAKKHRRVMLLVTDGEDLEGDPASVARAAAGEDVTIDVVQIGGRTPEAVPEVNPAGEVTGWRTDQAGRPLTTSLTAEGEAALAQIAELTGGMVVRSAPGTTGIRDVARALKKMMSEELSERVETVYADVFYYPLGLALLLLLVEVFVAEAPARPHALVVPPPAPEPPRRRRPKSRAAAATLLSLLLCAWFVGCGQIDELFTRNAPAVDEALAALDAGDASASAELLEQYLSTGACSSGEIGTPDSIRNRPHASFDLGLVLFRIGEAFGRRFGDEEPPGGADAGPTPEEETNLARRRQEIDCALRIVRLVAGDAEQPIELRARAHYLAGNLELLRREYRAAVTEYDASLRLIPGLPEDAGDGIGRDAAWNRAVALRRLEQQPPPDAGPDAAPPEAGPDANDAGEEAGEDAGTDSGPEGADGGQPPAPDAGEDGGEPPQQPEAGAPDAGGGDGGSPQNEPQPPPETQGNQDERMLDQLERAPTLQQESARNRALQRRVGGMEDK